MVKRRKLIVYYSVENALDMVKDIKSLNIVYDSKNCNFAVIYVDLSDFDELLKKLSSNSLITKIDVEENIFEF
jgi:uncharacterized protein YlbG (UPF0298 family)